MLPGQPSADWLAYSLTWGLLGEPGISWSGSSCAVGPPEKVQSAVSSCWFCLFLHKVSATFIHAPDSFDFSPLTQSLQPSSHTVNPSFINPALTPHPSWTSSGALVMLNETLQAAGAWVILRLLQQLRVVVLQGSPLCPRNSVMFVESPSSGGSTSCVGLRPATSLSPSPSSYQPLVLGEANASFHSSLCFFSFSFKLVPQVNLTSCGLMTGLGS